MLKLEEKQQPKDVSYLPQAGLESTRQLFVLVPYTEADTTLLTRRVWEIAGAGGFHIQFIGICNGAGNELATRRALVTMSSMMNYGTVSSEVEVVTGKNWLDNLKSRVNPGDMVVCWDAQTVSSFRSPLRHLLQANLNVPLYIIPGKSTSNEARSDRSRQAAVWIGFIAIMLGFLFLQIQIYQFANSWTTVLGLLSTAVEFWLIWAWNNWFK